MLGHLAPDVELTAAGPFQGAAASAHAEVAELCRAAAMDLTRKQLTRDRAVWDVRLPEGSGRIAAEIVDGKVKRLRLQPNVSTEAVRPCRWLRPPTGPISPATTRPATAARAEPVPDGADVAVGAAEQRRRVRAGEQQRAPAGWLAAVEQQGEVLARRAGVAQLEPHGPADLHDVADDQRPVASSASRMPRTRKSPRVLVDVLVDDDAELQPAGRRAARGRGAPPPRPAAAAPAPRPARRARCAPRG